MNSKELIKEIQKLPLKRRIYVIKRSMYLIRKQAEDRLMKQAVEELYEDYLTDKELTVFTDLDLESFYETR